MKSIMSQNGMILVNCSDCKAFYTITKENGHKIIYASIGGKMDMKLGTYKSSEHVKGILTVIANDNTNDVFEMPQQSAEWLNVSVRGSNAGASRNNKTRRGGS